MSDETKRLTMGLPPATPGDGVPPLPPWSPADEEYAAIVVTRPWQAVPRIQTQEANAATRAALEAENARLRAGIENLRIEHAIGREEGCVGWCDCGADEHNARIDALLQGEP